MYGPFSRHSQIAGLRSTCLNINTGKLFHFESEELKMWILKWFFILALFLLVIRTTEHIRVDIVRRFVKIKAIHVVTIVPSSKSQFSKTTLIKLPCNYVLQFLDYFEVIKALSSNQIYVSGYDPQTNQSEPSKSRELFVWNWESVGNEIIPKNIFHPKSSHLIFTTNLNLTIEGLRRIDEIRLDSDITICDNLHKLYDVYKINMIQSVQSDLIVNPNGQWWKEDFLNYSSEIHKIPKRTNLKNNTLDAVIYVRCI